jgi:hypothetical protein
MPKARITVNQARLKDGHPQPIHVHYVECDKRVDVSGVTIHGPSRVVYDAAGNQDGARVWIETDSAVLAVV